MWLSLRVSWNFHRQKLCAAKCLKYRGLRGQTEEYKMPIALSNIVQALPSDETWGPPTTSDSLVDGVPYAPYSKGDKLGRMADWTSGDKDRDGRGGRQQYNRNYRGLGPVRCHCERSLTRSFRSASLWSWHLVALRSPGSRGRILLLCGRQHPDFN